LIDEIIETRKILEPEMVRLAAHRATPEDIDFIKKSVDQMNAEIEEGLSGINGDTAFHFALASAAHNSAMTKILSLIADLLHYTMKASLQAVPDQSVTLEGHRQILAAVERKDADMACKLMREHLEVSHARIKNRSKINSAD
jgi:GntR family transcriptional repressor for pyruvate dehydrogenase complex